MLDPVGTIVSAYPERGPELTRLESAPGIDGTPSPPHPGRVDARSSCPAGGSGGSPPRNGRRGGVHRRGGACTSGRRRRGARPARRPDHTASVRHGSPGERAQRETRGQRLVQARAPRTHDVAARSRGERAHPLDCARERLRDASRRRLVTRGRRARLVYDAHELYTEFEVRPPRLYRHCTVASRASSRQSRRARDR